MEVLAKELAVMLVSVLAKALVPAVVSTSVPASVLGAGLTFAGHGTMVPHRLVFRSLAQL